MTACFFNVSSGYTLTTLPANRNFTSGLSLIIANFCNEWNGHLIHIGGRIHLYISGTFLGFMLRAYDQSGNIFIMSFFSSLFLVGSDFGGFIDLPSSTSYNEVFTMFSLLIFLFFIFYYILYIIYVYIYLLLSQLFSFLFFLLR